MKYRLSKLHDEIRRQFNSLEDFATRIPDTTARHVWDVITGKKQLKIHEEKHWAFVLTGKDSNDKQWQILIATKRRLSNGVKRDFSNKKWEPNPMVFDGSADLYLDDLKHI